MRSLSTYTFPIFFDEWNLDPKHITEAWDKKGDIIIGNDVWIGYEALIMSGVTIGDGAIIGARAVVTKDVPPYTIVAGVPAKTIRRRFNDEVIETLQSAQWWNWEKERIEKNLDAIIHGRVDNMNWRRKRIRHIDILFLQYAEDTGRIQTDDSVFLWFEIYEQKSIFAFSGNMCYKCLYMKFEKLCREPVYDLRIFIMVS